MGKTRRWNEELVVVTMKVITDTIPQRYMCYYFPEQYLRVANK
jgi:hypothetical protein